MSKNRKEYPKLRFALITEEALRMLQPPVANDTNIPSSSPAQSQDMYEMINATVNTILERKIRNLRLDKLEQLDKLDEIIENKVSEIQERRPGAQKSANGVHDTHSSNQEISIDTVSDFGQNLLRSDSQIFNIIDARIGEAKMSQKTWDTSRPQQQRQQHLCHPQSQHQCQHQCQHQHQHQLHPQLQPQLQAQPQPVPTRKSKIRQVSIGDRKKNSKSSQTNYVPPPQSHPIKKASDIITKYLSQFDNRYPQRK